MFTVIIHAANEAESFIQKAKVFLRKHFAAHDPKIIVRNAEAYDPKQHEHADAILTMPHHEAVIDGYEDRDTRVLVATEEELDRELAGPKPIPPEELPPIKPEAVPVADKAPVPVPPPPPAQDPIPITAAPTEPADHESAPATTSETAAPAAPASDPTAAPASNGDAPARPRRR